MKGKVRQMLKKKSANRKGFTLVEMMISVAFMGIITLGVGIVLADTQRGWSTLYNRVYSGVTADAEMSTRTFNSVVRKASRNNILLDETGTWVEVSYYQDLDSSYLDQYARFYTSGNELKVTYYSIDTVGEINELLTQTLCSNVSSCVFLPADGSVQMILRLESESETTTVVSSAVAHN